MPLKIICVTGPGSTGKSSIIREFTNKHLRYYRARGDILGIFQMPRLRYAVGVSGSGDALKFILKGQKFLSRYDGLKVMIVASRSGGETLEKIEDIANSIGAELRHVPTEKLNGRENIARAIKSNVHKIRQLMPGKA
jgi:AAA+ ATPase superfamily predicted ATPase